MKLENCKNYIKIKYGILKEKTEITLYNFESLDIYHDNEDGKPYYRICCDRRFYYYRWAITSIIEIRCTI